MSQAQVGVIGGTGLYDMEGLTDIREVDVATPFGKPSDIIVIGNLQGTSVAFLPRHGRGHRISPTEINARANVYALKTLGVEWLISVSAVGSMRETIAPMDIVLPDQLFDRTMHRKSTFFGDGVVAHIGVADPFCSELSERLYAAAAGLSPAPRVHRGGTYVCIEGPQFSTRAESRIYRQWGVDVIGMTAIPEAKLAREAEMCYAQMAMVTDYDVWHETEEAVTADMIVGNLTRNVETARRILRRVIPELGSERTCACGRALEAAIITAADRIPQEARDRLEPLIGKYL
jgi:5'-methylthioadenosine phosphorylase